MPIVLNVITRKKMKIKEGQIWYYPESDVLFLITAKITGVEPSWFIYSGRKTINVSEWSINKELEFIGEL